MNYRLKIVFGLVCAFSSLAGLQAANIPAEGDSVVAYRLGRWKTVHFDDAQAAQRHLETLKRLGCEAETHDHAGHIDVRYRQPTWTPLALATDDVAHQWESWLKRSGFETLHGHDEADHDDHDHAGHDHSGHDHGAAAEAVAYRMTAWKTVRVPQANQAAELVAIAQALGCEVQQDGNDVSMRCSTWKHAEFASHADATKWENWLRNTGFEARHEHGHNHQH